MTRCFPNRSEQGMERPDGPTNGVCCVRPRPQTWFYRSYGAQPAFRQMTAEPHGSGLCLASHRDSSSESNYSLPRRRITARFSSLSTSFQGPAGAFLPGPTVDLQQGCLFKAREKRTGKKRLWHVGRNPCRVT